MHATAGTSSFRFQKEKFTFPVLTESITNVLTKSLENETKLYHPPPPPPRNMQISRKEIKGTEKGYDCLDGIEFVMHRRGRACKVIDLIDLQQDRLHHVVSNHLKIGIPVMVHHVLLPPGEEVIDHDHAVSSLDQSIHQMASDESGSTCYENPQALSLQPQRDLAPNEGSFVDRAVD